MASRHLPFPLLPTFRLLRRAPRPRSYYNLPSTTPQAAILTYHPTFHPAILSSTVHQQRKHQHSSSSSSSSPTTTTTPSPPSSSPPSGSSSASPQPQPHTKRNPQQPLAPKIYTYPTLHPLTTSSSPSASPSAPRILLIDVREPSELALTGRIPGAYSMPLTSNPDAFHLSAEDFRERFGFEKPRARVRRQGVNQNQDQNQNQNEDENDEDEDENEGEDENDDDGDGQGVDEVIFYCKAGVRSRAAARLAREWEGVRVGDFRGGWMDWERHGGPREMESDR